MLADGDDGDASIATSQCQKRRTDEPANDAHTHPAGHDFAAAFGLAFVGCAATATATPGTTTATISTSAPQSLTPLLSGVKRLVSLHSEGLGLDLSGSAGRGSVSRHRRPSPPRAET